MVQALSNFNRDLYRTLQPPLTFISDRGEGRSSDSDFAVRPVLAQDGWEPLATSHECYASQGVHNDNLLLPWNGHNCMGFLLLSRAWVVPGITKPMNQLYTTHEFPRSDKLAGYTLPQVLSRYVEMIHHILPTLAPHLPLTRAERTKLAHVANTVPTAHFTTDYLSHPFLIFNNPTADNLQDSEAAKPILLRELPYTRNSETPQTPADALQKLRQGHFQTHGEFVKILLTPLLTCIRFYTTGGNTCLRQAVNAKHLAFQWYTYLSDEIPEVYR